MKLYSIFNKAAFLHIDIPNPFRGRLDLLPQGNTINEQYADYLQVRQHLCETCRWFRGMARNHPEFAEVMAEPRAHKQFSRPLTVNLSVPVKQVTPESAPAQEKKAEEPKPQKATPQTFDFGEDWANVSMEISQTEDRALIIDKRSNDNKSGALPDLWWIEFIISSFFRKKVPAWDNESGLPRRGYIQ